MECGGFDPLVDRPFDRSVENALIVVIHAEDEACIHHHTKLMQPSDGSRVIPVQVLIFVLLHQVRGTKRLKADKQTA